MLEKHWNSNAFLPKKTPLHSAALNIEDLALGFCWNLLLKAAACLAFRWWSLGPKLPKLQMAPNAFWTKGCLKMGRILVKPTAWSNKETLNLGALGALASALMSRAITEMWFLARLTWLFKDICFKKFKRKHGNFALPRTTRPRHMQLSAKSLTLAHATSCKISLKCALCRPISTKSTCTKPIQNENLHWKKGQPCNLGWGLSKSNTTSCLSTKASLYLCKLFVITSQNCSSCASPAPEDQPIGTWQWYKIRSQ